MTRRDPAKIELLLEWYWDVLNSWLDDSDGSYGFPRPHPALGTHSYRELERLLRELHSAEPCAYWMLAQRYWLAPVKPVLRCASCGPKAPGQDGYDPLAWTLIHKNDEPMAPFGVEIDHRHGRQVFTLRPTRVRVPSEAIRQEEVDAAVAWIAERWQGDDPEMPDLRTARERELDRAERRRNSIQTPA